MIMNEALTERNRDRVDLDHVVTVFKDKYARGWPRHADGQRGYLLPLGAALDRSYTSDAHFVAYRTPNGRRLVREALDQGVSVALTCIPFDLDCPETHGTSEPPPIGWRQAVRDAVRRLATEHPDPYYYETRGGARIVYRQTEPTIIKTQADAREWSQVYAVAVAYLERRFGLHADPSCCDWQRHYRLPRATRDVGGQPENHPVWGDVNKIGTLVINATPSDVIRAKRTVRRVFRPLREFAGNGDGLLFHALKLRGDIVGTSARGGWICLCPNRAEHTANTDGTDSTVVYPASSDVGAINCKHGHCDGFLVTDWLRFFTDAELDAARTAAGIVRAA
jgi:hypothetical protein